MWTVAFQVPEIEMYVGIAISKDNVSVHYSTRYSFAVAIDGQKHKLCRLLVSVVIFFFLLAAGIPVGSRSRC